MTTIQAEASSPHYLLGILDDVSPAGLLKAGDRMGFYKALVLLGSLTPDEMAEYTGVDEQCVHDWLHHEAATGRLSYSPKTRRFFLSREQAMEISKLGACVEVRS